MSKPLVSVVTPAFDEEDYLATCIESVLSQTYEHWDYAIIDNRSSDATGSIACEFAAGDERIRVIENERFLSQIENLNHAFGQISSECTYAKMVLADDQMFPRCLEEMVRVAEENPTVGLVTAPRQDHDTINCDGLEGPAECFNGREIGRATILDDLFVFGSPTTVMVRAEIVRGRRPFFDPHALHEDTEVCLDLLRKWDLGYVHEALTFTRRENESLTTARRAYDPAHRLDRLLMVARCGRWFLSEPEQQRRQSELEDDYYRFLGERVLYRLPEGFWEYHHEGLRSAGLRLRRGRLVKAVQRAGARQLLDPRVVARRVGRVLRLPFV